MPFNLLPQYIPDKKDVILMSKLYLKKPLTELENLLGIKQPAISLRLKKLVKFGYIFVNGRDRELSDLAKLIVKINITNNKIT